MRWPRRRKELDAREAVLNTQANMIAAAEQRVDAKIAQLKTLQTQIATLLGQRDEAQKAQIAALVKTYSDHEGRRMPRRIFNTLPDDVLVPVAQRHEVRRPGADAGQDERRRRPEADGEAGQQADPAPDHRRAGRRWSPRCRAAPAGALPAARQPLPQPAAPEKPAAPKG